MITGMEEKIKNKLDKEALGYNDKETLVNGILFYNHHRIVRRNSLKIKA